MARSDGMGGKMPSGEGVLKKTNIGTEGNIGPNKSNSGGQSPFLPPQTSYTGNKGKTSGGSVGKTTPAKMPFLPNKPE